jgi:hypothetical protein
VVKRPTVAHIVLFTPKATLSDGERATFLRTLESTIAAVPDIARARVGKRRVSDRPYEQLGERYAYLALLEFDSAVALQRYLEHPAHDALADAFYVALEQAEVGDFDLVDDVDALAI